MAEPKSSTPRALTVLGENNPYSVSRLRERRAAQTATTSLLTSQPTRREQKLLAQGCEQLLAQTLTGLKGAAAIEETRRLEEHALASHDRLARIADRTVRQTKAAIEDDEIRALSTIFTYEVVNRAGAAMATMVDTTERRLTDIVEREFEITDRSWLSRLRR